MLATVKGDVHDIGKNLVDIILTNNGYEVLNLGIKAAVSDDGRQGRRGEGRRHRHERPAREEHADHAREPRGAERPRAGRDPGAARRRRAHPRRTSSATCARSTTGRLFYGKDAFEGLHVMDRIGATKRGDAADDPDWGRVPIDSTIELPGRFAKRAATTPRRSSCPPAPPTSPPTTRCSRRRSSASQVVKGISLDDIAGFINETALFRNQWQFRPEKRRDRRRVQGPHPAHAPRASWPRPRPAGMLVPAGRLRLLPGQRRRRRPRDLDRRDPHAGAAALPLPAPARRTRSSASPTSSGPPTAGEVDYAAFHIVTMGPAVSEATAKLFADDRYQEYLLLHGLGVEMAEALAELLAPAHPRGVGLRRRGRPVAGRPVPPAVPRRPLLVGLPGLPRPRGQRHDRSTLLDGRPHRRECSPRRPASSTSPSRPPGPHLPPPPGQVLRRPLTTLRSVALATRPSATQIAGITVG